MAYDMIVALLSPGMALVLMWGYFDYSKSRLVIASDGMTYYGSGFRDVGFFIIDEIIRERHWQPGELGAYLRHYARQAFEGPDAQKEQSGR